MLQKTDDGNESTWAVNVMAPFLLTSLLLDHVKDRIVNVSSISAGSSMDFNNLQQVSKLLSLPAPASRLGRHAGCHAMHCGQQNYWKEALFLPTRVDA